MRRQFHVLIVWGVVAGALLGVNPLPVGAQEGQAVTEQGEAETDGCKRCSKGSNVGAYAAEAVEVEAGSGRGAVQVGGADPYAGCDWFSLEPGESIEDLDGLTLNYYVSPDPDIAYWITRCDNNVIDLFPKSEPPPAGVIDSVLRSAYELVPVVAFEPTMAPNGSADAPMITQLRTWLWVDEADWQPVSATASVPPLSVTTTATPVHATWTGGDDPEVVRCHGPGAPYNPNRDDDKQDDSCTTVFKHSSAVDDYAVNLEVTWEVSYECTDFCGSGQLPDIVTTSNTPVTVAEIQGIGTCVGLHCRNQKLE